MTLGLATLLVLLHWVLFPGVGRADAADAGDRPMIALAAADLCAAEHGAPDGHCHAPGGACCLSCDWSGSIAPPSSRSGDIVTRAASGRIARWKGRRFVLARAASGWRSSWSAQAPPLFS